MHRRYDPMGCVDGEWVDTGRRRCRYTDPQPDPTPIEPVSLMANVGGTLMEREEVRHIVRGTMTRAQADVRKRQAARDEMAELCRKCRFGERG